MKVGFLTQWYAPETGAAGLPTVVAEALQGQGHDVRVVTGLPNYPHGKLYPGYRFWHQHQEYTGSVSVYRAPLYVSHDNHPGRRMTNYLTFAASATAVALRKLRDVDAIWVHSTPATAALPAMVMNAIHDIPYILHIQDLWPATVLASGMLNQRYSTPAESVLHRFCDASYRGASLVAISAPGMRTALRRRGVPDSSIVDLPNWCDETVFSPLEVTEEAPPAGERRRPFTVMYAGAMGDVQGLDAVIGAAQLLRSQTDIGFAMVGEGVAKRRLVAECQRLDLDNVKFFPSQPMDGMAEVLAGGDIQLISLRDLPLYRITLPSKVQATLASGKPVICAATGNAASLVTDAGAGLTVTPESPLELADAVVRARDAGSAVRARWGASGRTYYERHLSQQQGLATMTSLLQEAAAGASR